MEEYKTYKRNLPFYDYENPHKKQRTLFYDQNLTRSYIDTIRNV